MNGASDPHKPYHFLKECNENFQMHVCKLLKDLGFLLRSVQNCKKCTFLDSLRTINQEQNMELDKLTHFFK